jgi:Pregnancy-associated plasma protein-A
MYCKKIPAKKASCFIGSMLIILFLLHSTKAQAQRTCGTTESEALELYKNPLLILQKKIIDSVAKKREADIRNGSFRPAAAYTIPVVFHILYRNDNENIPDEVINSQLTALNRDFNLQNADIANVPAEFQPAISNFELNFCLAAVDPSGIPTSGIERRQTTVDTFFSSQQNAKFFSLGGLDAWDRNRYLNIWVVPQLKSAPAGSAFLGYAAFPGGAANVDGVVIITPGFGDKTIFNYPLISNAYNRGRTAVHEVGHWLNLIHIWGDAVCGNDGVNDTPIHDSANYGCPSYPLNSNCGGVMHSQMTMNYMDYVNDDCMLMFTNDQKIRSIATLTTTRASLLNSQVFCPGNISINTSNSINGGFYKAADVIESTDILSSGETNTYRAGSRIVLRPGFRAFNGSTLTVKNGGCCTP